ncbi:hypothetical protein [Nitrosococcus wardiae]|uniref:hypothetical protein n=1 Tax=Nitrosococcus wardiae TaxID=1814290 RepID=UPI00197F5968|nr:hypothetical protein [Nitrosococcus wardiae]
MLANSEDMAEAVRREGARVVEVVGTPLSREFLKTPPAVLGGELTRVLFAGRLATEKNVAAAKFLSSLEFCIAGHGWSHRVERIGGLRHCLHSLLLSRKAGEHLALEDEDNDIAHLIARCHAWFQDHRLGSPDLYVPPAWAMGRLKWERLRSFPFRYYEVFGGSMMPAPTASSGYPWWDMRPIPPGGFFPCVFGMP